MRRDPTIPRAWAILGRYEYLLGDVPAAVLDYRQALALNPWSTDALNSLGLIALSTHDSKRAAEYFDRSLKVQADPDIARIRTSLR
jgi:Tfp pilus assembly protein PilF